MATQTWVAALVSRETRQAIGARDIRTFGDNPDKVQWRIDRPLFVSDDGICMLLVVRKLDGITVGIGRQGMCADIYTEALVTGVHEDQADAVVRTLYTAGRWPTAVNV